jgi:hypothetical protein
MHAWFVSVSLSCQLELRSGWQWWFVDVILLFEPVVTASPPSESPAPPSNNPHPNDLINSNNPPPPPDRSFASNRELVSRQAIDILGSLLHASLLKVEGFKKFQSAWGVLACAAPLGRSGCRLLRVISSLLNIVVCHVRLCFVAVPRTAQAACRC